MQFLAAPDQQARPLRRVPKVGRTLSIASWCLISALVMLLPAQLAAAPVARLNGAPIDGLTLDVLHQIASSKQTTLTRAATLDEIVSNRLLAGQVAQRFAQYDLGSNQRVAFDAQVAAEDQLVNYLRVVYPTQIQAALKREMQHAAQRFTPPTAAQWDAVFGSVDKILLDYSLTPAQLAQAKKLLVLRSRVPGAREVTLHDLIQRQNVQGRVEFFNRNQEFVAQQGQSYLASRIALNWAQQQFGKAALADLRQALLEREQTRALLALHGIGNDIDADSGLLNELAKKVTAQEIAAYYQANLSEFKRIARVRARHIRVDDEALAQQIVKRAAKGEDFAQLARQYSRAPDAAQGGALGWLVHENKLNWLAEIAFTQNPGQVSPPFRTPVGPNDAASWEIVTVEQREDGYQPLDSESVRYLARRGVAQQKALQQIAHLRQDLLRQATLQKLIKLDGAGSAVNADNAADITHGGKS